MRRRNDEHKEQCLLIRWWALQSKLFGIDENLLFAVPNGGARDVITGAMLKSEGVRSGVPDLFLALARGGWNGLFIEMKKPKGGVVSAAQKEMIGLLTKAGFCCEICRGFDEAKSALLKYIEKENK